MVKSILLISKGEFKRVLLHIPLGLLSCLLVYVHWVLSIGFVILFLGYELNEDLCIKDEAWKDIKGMLWGIGIGGVILFILKLIKGGII